jgi:hypothetical protein
VYQSRHIGWPIAQKLGRFAVVTGAAWLVASFALLALSGPSLGAAAAAATPSAGATAGCHPLSNEGTCYQPGEFCRATDHGMSGVGLDGEAIICEDNNGWRWEPQAGSATPSGTATTASTPTGASTGTVTSATPSATTSVPIGAPVTGGGTGPGTSWTMAATGCAVMIVGAGLLFLSRRRSHRIHRYDHFR